MNRQHKLCLDNTKHFCHFFGFTSSRNKVYCYGRLLEHLESSGTKIMMKGPHICQLWLEDLLYASHYCMPVTMRGHIVCQLRWEDLLYASYDERTYCMPVMMRGPIVCQLRWEDLLYASYDERTYCMPVMMRGPIVCQLRWEDLLYASYMWERYRETKNILKINFIFFMCFLRCRFITLVKDSRHAWSLFGANIGWNYH